jgi:hypothetical protein
MRGDLSIARPLRYRHRKFGALADATLRQKQPNGANGNETPQSESLRTHGYAECGLIGGYTRQQATGHVRIVAWIDQLARDRWAENDCPAPHAVGADNPV